MHGRSTLKSAQINMVWFPFINTKQKLVNIKIPCAIFVVEFENLSAKILDSSIILRHHKWLCKAVLRYTIAYKYICIYIHI